MLTGMLLSTYQWVKKENLIALVLLLTAVTCFRLVAQSGMLSADSEQTAARKASMTSLAVLTVANGTLEQLARVPCTH